LFDLLKSSAFTGRAINFFWFGSLSCNVNRKLFGRRDDGLVHHHADIVRISFCRDQKTLLKKAQRLTRRNQGGISTDGFTFVGANRL
jgi:hypothetical protein